MDQDSGLNFFYFIFRKEDSTLQAKKNIGVPAGTDGIYIYSYPTNSSSGI